MDIVYIFYFIFAFVCSFALTPFVRKYALARNIVASPGGRNIHTQPIARLGGVAVFSAFWLTIVLALVFEPERLTFVSKTFLSIDKNLFGVMLGAFILLITGIVDDKRGLHPGIKLIAHIIASLCVVAFGIRINWIHNPITNIDVGLGNWTYVIVPLWLVIVINVVNWLDGADGLASGIGLIASVILFLLSIDTQVSQPATALLAIILAGSLLGFLPYNFNPAKIFLGDTGSMFIGFMLGIFAIISGGKFATAALVLGFPILDAGWVVVRRLLKGEAPWKADRRHLHHRFLDAGFTQRQAVVILYGLSTFFGVVALNGGTRQKFIASFWLFGFMVILAVILILLEIKNRKQHNES